MKLWKRDRERERGDEGEIGDWMGFGLGLWKREAVRERIIKNCKRMNILLNKCVE